MARHSKHRQAPWKHGHLAEKHGMRYGTNEADNSLNNYIFPLMCYHGDEERASVREREREHAVKQPCHMLPEKQHTTIYMALIKTQIRGCLGSL